MIVFCTHCWHQCDSSDPICPNCKADLALDPRPYNEKLVSALEHPLPAARVRACWLIGFNLVNEAVGKLIVMADRDADLFVRPGGGADVGENFIHRRPYPFSKGLLITRTAGCERKPGGA